MRWMCGRQGVSSQWVDDHLWQGTGKSRGGAIFLTDQRDFAIKDIGFFLNHVQMDGGAIYLLNCRNITIQHCVFFFEFCQMGWRNLSGKMFKCQDLRQQIRTELCQT